MRIVEIEHFRIGPVVQVMPAMRAADHAERHREEQAAEHAEPVIAPRIRLQIAMCRLMQQRVIREHEIREGNARREHGPPRGKDGSQLEQQNTAREDAECERQIDPIGRRHVGRMHERGVQTHGGNVAARSRRPQAV